MSERKKKAGKEKSKARSGYSGVGGGWGEKAVYLVRNGQLHAFGPQGKLVVSKVCVGVRGCSTPLKNLTPVLSLLVGAAAVVDSDTLKHTLEAFQQPYSYSC